MQAVRLLRVSSYGILLGFVVQQRMLGLENRYVIVMGIQVKATERKK